jgi:hypothetical protein
MEMSHRHRTAPLLVAAAAIVALVGCGGNASSAVSSAASVASSVAGSVAGSLEQAKTEVCGKLADAKSALDETAMSGATSDEVAAAVSRAASLSSDLQNAADTLQAVGATDAADTVRSLATDLQNLGSEAPDKVAQAAQDASGKVTDAETTLGCPASATPSS